MIMQRRATEFDVWNIFNIFISVYTKQLGILSISFGILGIHTFPF